MEKSEAINYHFDLLLTAGIDNQARSTLSGHDPPCSPTGESVDGRKTFTYDARIRRSDNPGSSPV